MSENKLNEARVVQIHEAFASVPYAKFLGLELGEMKPGEANLHLEVRDELRQNQGVVHGGAVASLIDTASAFAAVTQLEPNERVTTTDLTIHLSAARYRGPSDGHGAHRSGRAATIRAFRRSHGQSAETDRHGDHDLHKTPLKP
jgi:uncharacterized protein (TIGR00369 family)